MDPIWQPTESIPFMKPTLHVNQTKLMAMMSPKWDPSASILWGPLTSLLTHAHEVDDKHMTSHLFLFLLLSTITVYSPHRRQPNNHIYLDQLLEAISWKPTIIIFWGDDLLLTIFFLLLITKCHLNHYRKYNDKKNNEKFFSLGYTILLVKYEQLIYL